MCANDLAATEVYDNFEKCNYSFIFDKSSLRDLKRNGFLNLHDVKVVDNLPLTVKF
jgi:hypothetical protein